MPRLGLGLGVGRGSGRSTAHYPAVALKLVGGHWVVDDANSTQPDGYAVFSGGHWYIDTGVSFGAALAVMNGHLYVGT